MIGALRHRLVLQESARTPDSGGGYAQGWANVAANPVLFAALFPAGDGLYVAQRQRKSRVTHRLRIRYREDVAADMRLIDDEKAYHVQSAADPDGTKAWLDILAEERPL
jgi:SPP1 family predicted phage head-tail adaptor